MQYNEGDLEQPQILEGVLYTRWMIDMTFRSRPRSGICLEGVNVSVRQSSHGAACAQAKQCHILELPGRDILWLPQVCPCVTITG
jgi:hypothetical protein